MPWLRLSAILLALSLTPTSLAVRCRASSFFFSSLSLSDVPLEVAPVAMERVTGSFVVQSTLFQCETSETPRYDYATPIDDTVEANCFVGDWEELFIRTYHRVFRDHDHALYWGRSEIGPFVTCVGRAVPELGHPTLSLGPNGFHFARLAVAGDAEFPTPKQLARLFPHWDECRFSYAREAEKLSSDLASFELKVKPTRYKFGVLYAKEGQTEENDIYGNLDPSRGFVDFLKVLGDLIELKDHRGYRGGLDCSGANTTGELSVFTKVQIADGIFVRSGAKVPQDAQELVDLEIMFHVAPFLPHSSAAEDGNQQLHKKRHLGNDICVVVFREGISQLDPNVFKSQFNHVYIVVTPVKKDGTLHFLVEVVTKGLKGFLPTMPPGGLLTVDSLRDWLILKLINGEVASMNAKGEEDFMPRCVC